MEIEKIAALCHETNRSYCRLHGDYSQQEWDFAPDWEKASAIKGVEFVRDNPHAGPSASHDSWLAEKEATGWKYGPTKDPEKKEHPCFVPYDKLPADQRRKDELFVAIVKSCL